MTRLVPLVILLFVFASCRKEVDEDSPQVTQFTVDGNAVSSTTTNSSSIQVQASFSDNEALGQYQLFIEDSTGRSGDWVWEYAYIAEVSGTNANETQVVTVPDTVAAGIYVAQMRVLDAAGNNGDTARVVLYITRTDAPTLSLVNPVSGFSINTGDTVVLDGTATGTYPLATMDFDLGGLDTESLLWSSSPLPTSYQLSDLVVNGQYLIVPDDADAGAYELLIDVTDSLGNFTRTEVPFTVN